MTRKRETSSDPPRVGYGVSKVTTTVDTCYIRKLSPEEKKRFEVNAPFGVFSEQGRFRKAYANIGHARLSARCNGTILVQVH